MTYREALDYLYDNMPMFHRIGAAAFKPDLSNSLALSQFLEKPEQSFKTLHIAGTNGKGSTAHMMAAILQSAGYNVGLYTSPHYRDFRERIKINGQYISEIDVIDFIVKVKPFVNEFQPSFFELTVGMAFDHFRKNEVDIAIIEVGMGGRLDATNIITPICSVITNIGFDHEQFLGNTLAKIAGEKAGIIKQKVPVVIGEYNMETKPVFEKSSRDNNADIYYASTIFEAVLTSDGIEKQIFDIYKLGKPYLKDLEMTLTGAYQIHNLKTVISTVEILREKGFEIAEKSIRIGLSNVREISNIIGRWDILQKEKPIIICDSAHNPHGLKYISEALKKMKYSKMHIVFGMVSDKSPEKLLAFMPEKAEYYFCKADIPRGLPAEKLLEAAKIIGLNGNIYNSVKAAFEAAKENAEESDVIYVGGSIFVVGEII